MKNGILNALKMFEAHFKRQIAPLFLPYLIWHGKERVRVLKYLLKALEKKMTWNQDS